MEEERTLNDDEIVLVGTEGFTEILYSRYTVKVLFTMGESAYESYILQLWEIFKNIQTLEDRKCFITLWYDDYYELYEDIGHFL